MAFGPERNQNLNMIRGGTEMKLLDILRKLGILRYGAVAGTYTSAKDAPHGLVGDELYYSRKDKSEKEEDAQPHQ